MTRHRRARPAKRAIGGEGTSRNKALTLGPHGPATLVQQYSSVLATPGYNFDSRVGINHAHAQALAGRIEDQYLRLPCQSHA